MLRHLLRLPALALVLVGCVSEDPGPTSANDAGASNTDSAPNTDGAAATGDSGTSTGATNRSIVCDGTSTCTGDQSCCGGGNSDWIGAACKTDCGGAYRLLCDDASDCASGQVCCYKTDGGARAVSSYCAAACRPNEDELQLCDLAKPTECRTGACTPLTNFSPEGLASCK